jgi:hypothetical protein
MSIRDAMLKEIQRLRAELDRVTRALAEYDRLHGASKEAGIVVPMYDLICEYIGEHGPSKQGDIVRALHAIGATLGNVKRRGPGAVVTAIRVNAKFGKLTINGKKVSATIQTKDTDVIGLP